MKYKIIFLLLVSLMLIPFISCSSFYIPQDTNYSILFNCEIDGAICSGNAQCNVSIEYPNSTSLITNQEATQNPHGRYSYNLSDSQTSFLGEDYTLNIACYDGGTNGSETIYFGVNPSGIRPSDQRTATITRSIYFIFIIGLLLFLGFLFTKQSLPTKWTLFGFSIIFFLIGVNILFVGIKDEIINPKLQTFFSSFTTISWYFYWFIGGLLIIMWALTFINTWVFKKNMENARRYELV